MTAVIFHSPFHVLGSRRQTVSPHRTADSFLFGHEFGLRHPASASCLGRHLRLAGRCPNSNSLFPPLAAVVAVASHSIARPIALRATGSHPADGPQRNCQPFCGFSFYFLIFCKCFMPTSKRLRKASTSSGVLSAQKDTRMAVSMASGSRPMAASVWLG